MEAILLVQRTANLGPGELALAARLHKLCVLYDDNGLKVRPSTMSLSMHKLRLV